MGPFAHELQAVVQTGHNNLSLRIVTNWRRELCTRPNDMNGSPLNGTWAGSSFYCDSAQCRASSVTHPMPGALRAS